METGHRIQSETRGNAKAVEHSEAAHRLGTWTDVKRAKKYLPYRSWMDDKAG